MKIIILNGSPPQNLEHRPHAIAMENLWLETDAQGLGGVWLGIAPIEERMQAVEQVLELPERVRAFAIFPLGYPAEKRGQQDRFDPNRIHFVE